MTTKQGPDGGKKWRRSTPTVPQTGAPGELYIHSRCHPVAPTWVVELPGAQLRIECSVCGKTIAVYAAVDKRGACELMGQGARMAAEELERRALKNDDDEDAVHAETIALSESAEIVAELSGRLAAGKCVACGKKHRTGRAKLECNP